MTTLKLVSTPTMVPDKSAWAVVQNGDIFVNTTSSTDRGSMIRFLEEIAGIQVPEGMGDFAIRDRFANVAAQHNCRVERVVLVNKDNQDALRQSTFRLCEIIKKLEAKIEKLEAARG